MRLGLHEEALGILAEADNSNSMNRCLNHAELRVSMRVEIAKLHMELGNTMIYVTHDQTEAMTLADKIVVLRAGLIEQVGAPLHLYDDPDNLLVAGFIGSPKMNFISAEASAPRAVRFPDGMELAVPNLSTDLSTGQKITVGIRPEHLQARDAAAAIRQKQFQRA